MRLVGGIDIVGTDPTVCGGAIIWVDRSAILDILRDSPNLTGAEQKVLLLVHGCCHCLS